MIFKPQVLAIVLALSIFIFSPTLPVCFISPFSNGTCPAIKIKLLFIFSSIASYFIALGNNYDAFGNELAKIKFFKIPSRILKNLAPVNKVNFFILTMIMIGIFLGYILNI